MMQVAGRMSTGPCKLKLCVKGAVLARMLHNNQMNVLMYSKEKC